MIPSTKSSRTLAQKRTRGVWQLDPAPITQGSTHVVGCDRVPYEKSIFVLLQLSYSPYLALCDYFFFPNLKNDLKGRHHFYTVENTQ